MTTQTKGSPVEVTRYVADYRGARYAEQFAGTDWIAVAATPEQRAAGLFPDEIEHGENRSGPWVKLPKSSVDRRVKIVVTGRWRGEPVGVTGPVEDGMVYLDYAGSPARARELGMEGDQYNGWRVRVPVDEVSDVTVVEKEY